MHASISQLSAVGLPALTSARPSITPVSRQVIARPAHRSQEFRKGSRTAVRASSGDDFDSILTGLADKFEKSENKGAIIGYGVAGVLAFFFSEWLIHLPGLNFTWLGYGLQRQSTDSIVAGIAVLVISKWTVILSNSQLLGFPIQLVGLLSLPYLGVRYLADGKDFKDDAKTAAGSITKRLPGLEK